MSAPADNPPEPVSVVIPVRNAGGTLAAAVAEWCDTLQKLGHGWELILVDDGSTDDTAARAEELAARRKHVRVLRHESPRGFGASLRSGFAEARHPLVFYTALDYPYTPADLRSLLSRIDQTDEVFGRKLDVVNGCRTGRRVPAFWKAVGFAFRLFCRVALGLPLDPVPGWLGLRNHLRSWWAWPLFGVPVLDTDSAFKLFRRRLLDRFPVQSDGGFVHAELLAKATFLACLMDELPLSPKPDPIPDTDWSEWGKVFKNAEFYPPAEPTAPAPTPEPPSPVEPAAPTA